VTQRIEPVGPRRDAAPVERILLTPLEREAERERRERRRRQRPAQPAKRPSEPPPSGSLDIRA
jgi:hypothetical protein